MIRVYVINAIGKELASSLAAPCHQMYFTFMIIYDSDMHSNSRYRGLFTSSHLPQTPLPPDSAGPPLLPKTSQLYVFTPLPDSSLLQLITSSVTFSSTPLSEAHVTIHFKLTSGCLGRLLNIIQAL